MHLHNPQGRRSVVSGVEGLRTAVIAVLVATALAGCGARSDGAVPDRPSVVLDDRLVDGQRLDHDGSIVYSGLPEEAAPVLSPDRPMNCFTIETDTGETTYLGGALVTLTWTPVAGAAANLTVTASNLPAGSWRASGPSPLVVNAIASDEQPVQLPMLVQVEPTGQTELGFEQEIDVHVTVGLRESLIDALAFRQATCPS